MTLELLNGVVSPRKYRCVLPESVGTSVGTSVLSGFHLCWVVHSPRLYPICLCSPRMPRTFSSHETADVVAVVGSVGARLTSVGQCYPGYDTGVSTFRGSPQSKFSFYRLTVSRPGHCLRLPSLTNQSCLEVKARYFSTTSTYHRCHRVGARPRVTVP